MDLVDVERVEVLRGPQGTLFGRNTTGGALNIVTPDPSGTLEGFVTGTIGNYDNMEVLGAINLLLSGDQLALRVSFKHSVHSGSGRNRFLDTDIDDMNKDFLRVKLDTHQSRETWNQKLT